MSWNVWNRLLGSSMVGMGILPNNTGFPSPECYTTFWRMTIFSDTLNWWDITPFFYPLLIKDTGHWSWPTMGLASAIGPELAFSRAEHSLPYSDVTIYIFAISYLLPMLYVYRFLWPLRLGWLLVWCLYKEVYLQIFKCVSFWLHGCCGEWEGWARKPG